MKLVCVKRESNNVSQYLLKNLQLIKGMYSQRSINFGSRYNLKIKNLDECCNNIIQKRYKCICLNDNELLEDISIFQVKLVDAFNDILPSKSKFEL